MKCPSCEFENIRGSVTCIRCQAALVWEGPRGREHFRPPRAGLSRRTSPSGGNQGGLHSLGLRIWKAFAVFGKIPGRRWAIIAASVVPGLGQTRGGRIVPGIMIFSLWLAAVVGGWCIHAGSEYDSHTSSQVLPYCLLAAAGFLHYFAMVDAAKPVDFCNNRGELLAFLALVAFLWSFCYHFVNQAFLGW